MTKIQHKSGLGRLLLPLLLSALITGCQTVQPAQVASETPVAAVPDANASAAENTRTLLAKQLHIDPATIEIVSDETVEWSDACLGLGLPAELCNAVVTPGHKITLSVAGAQYVFHTDRDGYQTRLASAPDVPISAPILSWSGSVDNGSCLESTMGTDDVSFGLCGGQAQIGGDFASDARRAVLSEWANRYAPFTADGEFGSLRFSGQGTEVADSETQRLITRWARMATMEAAAGESLAGMEYRGPAEMGSPDTSKCAVLRLGTPIEAGLGACDGTMTEKDMGKRTYLDWEYFRDHVAPFVYETDTETLTFDGMGTLESEAWQRAILAWARARHAELASGRTSATISTAMSWSWGKETSQNNICRHLTVLNYGYAYAEEVNCDSGDVINTTADWLTTAELEQLDLWLYQRTPLYLDNNYIDGKGSQEMSEAEQGEVGLWAMDLTARIAGVQTVETPSAEFPQCPAASSESKPVIDTGRRFCLLIPATYTLFEPNPDEVVIAKDSLLNVTDPRLAITVADAAGRSTTAWADEVAAQFTGFEIAQGTITVDGVEAVMLDNLPGQDLNRRVLFVQNGRFYDLTFSPLGEAGEARSAFEAFYQSTLDSWHFLDESVATPTPEPSAIAVTPTDVAFVQAQVNVNIRSGPGTNYEKVGGIAAGQSAKVTGVTADNSWWRVICPDGSTGNCFVVNDPQLVQPATPPASGSTSTAATITYADDRGFTFDYPADWSISSGEAGPRASIVPFKGADGTVMDLTIQNWDPKHDLNAFAETRKTAWAASGMTVIDEQTWSVGTDHPALRFIVRSADGNENGFFLFTTLGDQYLTLGGSGNLDALNAVGQSLRVNE